MATDSVVDTAAKLAGESDARASSSPEDVTPGQILSVTRTQNGIDRDDAARAANLGVSIVVAMESDDFASLGLPVYARGYYRRYAKVIQCDADAVLSAYERVTDNPSPVPQIAQRPSIPYGGKSTGQRYLPFVALALVAALVAYLFLSSPSAPEQNPAAVALDDGKTLTSDADPAASSVTPSLAPLPDARALVEVDMQQALQELDQPAASERDSTSQRPAATDAGPMVPPNRLEISTGPQAAWIEVIDALGEKLAYRVVNPGERLIIEGDPPYSINLGMAHTLMVRYAGKPLDLRPVTDSASRARATIAANGELVPR